MLLYYRTKLIKITNAQWYFDLIKTKLTFNITNYGYSYIKSYQKTPCFITIVSITNCIFLPGYKWIKQLIIQIKSINLNMSDQNFGEGEFF